jgi:1-acyl-sn-glycerol-3-phosphate acyltransferase
VAPVQRPVRSRRVARDAARGPGIWYQARVNALIAAVGYVFVVALIGLSLPVQAAIFAFTAPFDPSRIAAGRYLRWVGRRIADCYPPWKLRVEGSWPEGVGACVVVANHQSILDILLLSRMPREMKWIAKEVLFRVPWIGWMLRMSGDIAIERGERDSGVEALGKARAHLARGVPVMVFAEGTRSRDGRLLPFKSGAFRLAIEAGVPILPVAVNGTGEGMPKGGPWVRPCVAWARILEPVSTAGLKPEDAVRLKEDVRRRIAAALPGGVEARIPPRRAQAAAPPTGAAVDEEESLG